MNEEPDPLQAIDHVLATEPHAPAPPALGARVMHAVRREAYRPRPLPFPWLRFAAGVAAGILTCVLVGICAADLQALR